MTGTSSANEAEIGFEEFQRIYGPIRALSPEQAHTLFLGATFRWWVAGGWSTELAKEQRRFHEDLEVCISRAELPAVRQWLSGYHLWDTHGGALRFLSPESDMPEDHDQLWVRRNGHSAWLMDLMLTALEGETWFYKRDRRLTRPMSEVVRIDDRGIPFQRPEITLLYKARRRWTKDEDDLRAVVPLLDAADRAWLRDAIALSESTEHPWLEQI